MTIVVHRVRGQVTKRITKHPMVKREGGKLPMQIPMNGLGEAGNRMINRMGGVLPDPVVNRMIVRALAVGRSMEMISQLRDMRKAPGNISRAGEVLKSPQE